MEVTDVVQIKQSVIRVRVIRQRGQLSYSKKKKRQLQEEKEARLNKTPEKETRSVIKQSKAFVRKVSYSYE